MRCVTSDRLPDGLKSTLDRWVHGDGIAVGAVWIAVAAGKIQLNVRRTLIHSPEFESKTEMLSVARREISEARQYHRRKFEEIELGRSCDWIGGHAHVTHAR